MLQTLTNWLHTIRGRLTLWYTGSFIILFSAFFAIASLIFWNILNQQIDHHLETVLEQVETVWHQAGDERENIIQSLVASEGMVVMIMAPDGDILTQTTSEDISLPTQHQLQQHLVMLQKEPAGTPHYFTVNSLRFALMPTIIPPTQGVIGVGFQTTVLQTTFQRSLAVLATVSLVFVVIVGLFGYILAKRALQPIRTITTTAKSITSSTDLQDRIPATESSGELQELIHVLNSMFDRLEISFKTQRQFLSDAAHTLKTPLTIVRTHVEKYNTEDKNNVLATLDTLNETVQDLLYLSRLQATTEGEKQQVDLTELLQEIIDITTTLATEKEIVVETSIETNLSIQADKSLLTRALLNITENAISYTPPQETVAIFAQHQGDTITITIEDTGIGIPSRELQQITNRFYRASNTVGSGTGLGLAITETIISSMEGTLEINSEKNHGTTVTITLPAN